MVKPVSELTEEEFQAEARAAGILPPAQGPGNPAQAGPGDGLKPVEDLSEEEFQAEAQEAGFVAPSGGGAFGAFGINPLTSKTAGFLKTLQDEAGKTTSSDIKNIGISGLRRFLDIAGQSLQLPGDIFGAVGAAGQTIGDFVNSGLGIDKPVEEGFFARFDRNSRAFDESPLGRLNNQIPTADSGDGLAAIDALQAQARDQNAIEDPADFKNIRPLGEQFDRSRKVQRIDDATNEAVRPIGTAFGNFFGNTAGLAAFRGPGAAGRTARATQGRIKRAEAELLQKDKNLAKLPANVRGRVGELSPKLQGELRTSFLDNIVPNLKIGGKSIGRGAGKIAEAGMEGAVQALLTDGDPAELFAFSAGTQGAGSLSLALSSKIFGGRFGSVASGTARVFASTFLLHEMINAAGPGDQDLFGSKDFAVQSVVASYVLAGAAAFSGSGRLNSAKYPAFADAATQAGRTLTRDTFQLFMDERFKGGIHWRVLTQMRADLTTNSPVFNQNQLNSLDRALEKGPVAFKKEVARQTKANPDFASIVNGLS